MASRYYRTAGPDRRASELDFPSDSDLYSASDEELITQQANDRRLRQAISYIADEGGADPPEVYVEYVQRIDDSILKQYREEGYSFNPKLYRQLRSMIREVQADFQRIAEEESSVSLEDTDASIEELLSPEVLYRGGEDDSDDLPVPESSRRPKAPPPQEVSYPKLRDPLKKAEVRETQFLYGGPDNEVEEWHKDFPAMLPFGETLYMQEWESMKINYDLRESAKKSAADASPIVETNVPYDAVDKARIPTTYESGSRFKLPNIGKPLWSLIKRAARTAMLPNVLDELNTAGSLDEQVKKDYAPRVFLHPVAVNEAHQYYVPEDVPTSVPISTLNVPMSSKAAGKQPVGRPSLPPTPAGPSIPCKSSTTGYLGEGRKAQIRNHPQRATESPASDIAISQSVKKPSAVARRLEERRAKAIQPVASRVQRSASTDRAFSTDSPIGGPSTRRLSHILAGSSTKRGPGGPAKATPPTPTPEPRVTRAAIATSKRRLSSASSSTPEAKRVKPSPNAPAKKAPPKVQATPSKKVAFAEEEAGPSTKPQTRKKEIKGGIKNTMKPESVGRVERKTKPSWALQGVEKITPGVTRHGTKFK
ncbi:hypothetical protein BU26DRAFT_170564 [Trematosphaeria pertusa]|uniref:Uncharacterized protein n=1 Tax=Trematosphaeria pertusa TaxID=390896 RepID=A0A6A6HWP1_9PLEO|nr:uncharacterized protein BU26DRAFT_170564 [Trematosphaeria pertusa]KAF2241800.1 hypothetical protein BU26DRAFT_170564 [Trematosphaeria pertusa]